MALGKTLRIPGRRPAPPHPTAPVTSYLILRCKETTLEYQLLIYIADKNNLSMSTWSYYEHNKTYKKFI